MTKLIECNEMGHDPRMQVRGESDDELVRAMEGHVGQYHPGMSPTREKILGMAKEA